MGTAHGAPARRVSRGRRGAPHWVDSANWDDLAAPQKGVHRVCGLSDREGGAGHGYRPN